MRLLTFIISIILLGTICSQGTNVCDLPTSGLSISCDNISGDGVGSSYEPHTFSLSNDNESVSDYNWSFSLKDKEGHYTQISSGVREVFTIGEILSADDYFINSNGDLEGKIECDYTSNGKRHSAVPFSLSLELKPVIFSIYDITTVNVGDFTFYLDFYVRYAGAEHLYVEVEEEYSTSLITEQYNEPYIAHAQTGNISNLYYSWVTVLVINKYGTASETMEFAPSYASDKSIPISSDNSAIKEIVLYSIDGTLIYKGIPYDVGDRQLNPGVYIKEEIMDNGNSKSSKLIVR